MSSRILILHPNRDLRDSLVGHLSNEIDDIRLFGDAESAGEAAKTDVYDIAIVENTVLSPGGIELASELKTLQPHARIILLAEELDFLAKVKTRRLGITDIVAEMLRLSSSMNTMPGKKYSM